MLRDQLAPLLPHPIARLTPITTGVGGSITRITLDDASTLIAKAVPAGSNLDLRVEARMLDLLRDAGLPTPTVLASEPGLLIMQDIEHDGRLSDEAQRHAADLLAALHTSTSPVPLVAALGDQCSAIADSPETAPSPSYGLHEDNTIGPLPQPNTWHTHWPTFFGERRLLPMLERARRAGAVGPTLAARIERLIPRLPDLLPATPRPSLIHGDVWSGNVLPLDGRIAAFIDPAPYYAHAEVELAFITLFSTFGPAFFDRYASRAPELHAPDLLDHAAFTRTRRDLYNLYPLLVHCTLFGGAYVIQLDRGLASLGF